MRKIRITRRELKERWNVECNPFFKKVIQIGISIGVAGGAILASPVALPAVVVTIGGYAVATGAAAAFVAKLTKP